MVVHPCLILAPGRLRQGNRKFEANLSYNSKVFFKKRKIKLVQSH